MLIVKRVFNFFRKHLARLYKWKAPQYQTLYVEDELPKTLQIKTIYIVKEDDFLWHASMLCPCSCGELLHMNLIPDERPCWHLIENTDSTVSLYPSIWRKVGCQSHFWFRHSKIYWCHETIFS